MIRKNPYRRANKKAQTLISVVVYLDVLGLRDQIREAYQISETLKPVELLHRLRDALDKSICHLKEECSRGIRLWEIKAFTDNIVLGFPISSDGESEMGSTFFFLSFFQFQMVLSGFFVRGALSIGEHYMDTDIVFGAALLEAYDAERNIARDPRIILTKSATRYLKKHLKYYAKVRYSPQYRAILKDVDGQFFLNYLEILIDDNGFVQYKELKQHRDIIVSKLSEYKYNPRIWSKYAWVANYHNYFCDQNRDVDPGNKIDAALFQLQPTRISTKRT